MSDATTHADSSSRASRCGMGRQGSMRTALAAAAATAAAGVHSSV
jgi:hypothetical protein